MSLIDDTIKEPEPPEPFLRPWWPLRLIAGLLLILAAYALWYEPASLRAVEHPVRIGAGTTMRIAVIADLRGGAPYIGEQKIAQAVALANRARPDLILLTGDYVRQDLLGGWPMPIESIAEQLKALRAPFGVYAVLGSHDRRTAGVRIERALNTAGIAVLEDRAARIGIRGHTFYLAGISDYAARPHVVAGAMLGIPVGQKAVCFTHAPDVFPQLPRTCLLTIAGHGGQVDLPILGRVSVPSRRGGRYGGGLVHEDGKYLFVSTGIGTSILPVRFGVRPEVSILDVR